MKDKKQILKEQLQLAEAILGLIRDDNIKHYEYVFQYCIERVYVGEAWWNITNCDIFLDLLQHKDAQHTIDAILTNIK